MSQGDALDINAFGIAYEGKSGFSKSRSSPGPPEAVIASGRSGLRPGLRRRSPPPGASRLVALLFALAAVAWWSTADRMGGMDEGPGTDLGALGWFLGVWVVMMAAMMFPSVAPTVALYSRMTRRGPLAPLVFAAGYLLTWTAAGLLAYGLFELGGRLLGDALAWDARALGRRRHPRRRGRLRAHAAQGRLPRQVPEPARFPPRLLARRSLGRAGDGRQHGAWCVGCCWALMAALFALGVMSLAWMAFVAALIALEKTLPWGRAVDLRDRRASCSLWVFCIVVVPERSPA